MGNFRKVVQDYKQWKLKEHKNPKLTAKEVSILRRNFLKETNEQSKVENKVGKKNFKETVDNYRAWKLKEYKDSSISSKEIKKLRKEFISENKKEIGNLKDRSLQETVSNYRAWKLKKYGSSKIDEIEISNLKRRISEKKAPELKFKSLKEAVLAYKQWKLKEKGDTKVSKQELLKIKEDFYKDLPASVRIREQVKLLKKTVEKLTEGDTAPSVDPNALADPNAAPADPNDPNAVQAQTPVDPTVQDAIKQIKDQVAALADQVGIVDEQGDLAANPDAGIPPVDGTTPDGAAVDAAAPAPVAESKKPDQKEERIKAIRERLATREKTIQEASTTQNEAQRVGQSAVLTAGLPITSPNLTPDQGVGSDTNPPSQLDQPAEPKIAAGVATGPSKEIAPASTWPTKTISEKGAIKESTDSYAERYLNSKLNEKKANWNDISEALKSGLLG